MGMKKLILTSILCLVSVSSVAVAEDAKNCANDLNDLRKIVKDPRFSLNWVETSMDDGKPLQVEISEKNNEIYLEFNKMNEGLWAAGSSEICAKDETLVAEIEKEKMEVGPAAPRILKWALGRGGTFELERSPDNQKLKISTTGWSGEFVPVVPKPSTVAPPAP